MIVDPAIYIEIICNTVSHVISVRDQFKEAKVEDMIVVFLYYKINALHHHVLRNIIKTCIAGLKSLIPHL